MGLLRPGVKARLESVTEFMKTTYHVAFIPFVIYMGFKKGPELGGPEFGLLSLSAEIGEKYDVSCGSNLKINFPKNIKENKYAVF